MDAKEELQVSKLADEHWRWIESVLDVQMRLTEKLFKDAFMHGWRHKAKEVADGRHT